MSTTLTGGARRNRSRASPAWPLNTALLLALAALVVSFFCHVLATTAVAVWATRLQPGVDVAGLEAFHRQHMGTVQSVAACLRGVALLLLALGAVAVRRGLSARRVFPLARTRCQRLWPTRWPALEQRVAHAPWTGAVLVLVAGVVLGGVLSAGARVLGVTPAPSSWWSSVDSAALFILGHMVLAPLGEELMFRGVVFTGIRHGRFCGWGAGFMAALWWTTLYWHVDPFTLAVVPVVGALLGWMRARAATLVPGLLLRVVALGTVVLLT